MKWGPLTENEIAASGGFTHRLDFSYRDVASLTIASNTAATWGAGYLPALPAHSYVGKTLLHLSTAFSDASDSAFNDSSISFGETTTATRFINAVQGNVNGTEVIDTVPGAVTNAIYAAAAQLQLTMNSMTNKVLSNLDGGEAYILCEIHCNSAAPREQSGANPGTGR